MNKQGLGLYVVLCVLLLCDMAVHWVRAQPLPNAAMANLRTHQLELVNWKGVVTAKIYNGPDGAPVLLMNDQNGRGRLLMTANDAGTGLSIHDAQGKPALQLGAGKPTNQPAEITLYSSGVPRVDMHSGLNGAYGFTALDSNSAARAVLEYRKGAGQIAVNNKGGKPIWQAPLSH